MWEIELIKELRLHRQQLTGEQNDILDSGDCVLAIEVYNSYEKSVGMVVVYQPKKIKLQGICYIYLPNVVR